jgi:hypothetical protein
MAGGIHAALSPQVRRGLASMLARRGWQPRALPDAMQHSIRILAASYATSRGDISTPPLRQEQKTSFFFKPVSRLEKTDPEIPATSTNVHQSPQNATCPKKEKNTLSTY